MTASLYQALFDHVGIGMALLNRHLKVIEANRRFIALTGAERLPEEMSLGDLLLPEEAERLRESFSRFIAGTEEPEDGEFQYRPADGEIGWLSIRWSLVPHPSKSGRLPLAAVTDVSDRKADALRWETESIEARRSAQTKSDFLANMSHEIRTPIHTITGMTELLLDTQLDAEQSEYTNQIQYSADVLQGLINDILDFSKIEAGRLKLETINFDLHDLVEDSVKLVSMEAHKKGLEVAVSFDQDVPHLLQGDPVRLRQIIVNLFNNAVKFTHQGEIIIYVALEGEDDEAAKLCFRVRDSGIGIPEDKMNRLFKVFSQVDSSTTRKYGGTGLGLSISRNLTKMMGGEIGVESTEGEGSTFWFTCVLTKQKEESLYRNLTGDFFEDTYALVCDDNASSRRILASYLAGWGCRVEEVDGAEAALKLLHRRAGEKNPFTVALIDQIMPGRDGWQLASEINNDKAINSTKLILMSPAGRSGEEAKMKLLKWFDGYLNKPIKKNDLFEIIFTLVNADVDLQSVDDLEVLEEAESMLEVEKGKILVAEDHEVNQTLFKTILENEGYTVSIANNGKEAVELSRNDEFALIFMDVQMPEMNGYEATESIRQGGNETPIIAVTASAIKGEQEKCLAVGMNDFLTKPFKKRDLLPMLDKWALGSMVARKNRTPDEEQASMGEIDPEVFAFDEAVETFMGQAEVVIKVLEGFLPKVERQIAQMKLSLKEEDFDQLRADAHSIKGSSWNLMVKRLGNRAAELEQSAKEEKSDASALHLMSVEDAFQEFKSAAEEILLRHSS